ncbi:MAG: hypothetical protein ACTSRU_06010 [Candidatus Hodarchaeales archaeon]
MKITIPGIARIRKGRRAQVFMMAVLVISVYMATMVMLLANLNSTREISNIDTCSHAVSSLKRELSNQLQVSLALSTKNSTSNYDAESEFIDFLSDFESYSSTSLGVHLELSLFTGSFSITSFSDLSVSNLQDLRSYNSSISARIAFIARDVSLDTSFSGIIEANYTAIATVNGFTVTITEQLYSGPIIPSLFAKVTSIGVNSTVATSLLDN